MTDLTVEGILAIHAGILARDGGDGRVLSEANLHQTVFQVNLQPDPIARAAAVIYILCAYRSFRDGNKRTARAAAESILAEAGYIMEPDGAPLYTLMKGVGDFSVETDQIDDYLRSTIQRNG